MGVREQPVCDQCDRDIVPNEALFDRQGQEVHIRFAAYTQKMTLCEDCIVDLDKWRRVGTRILGGTVTPRDALPYLPKLED